MSRFTVRVKLRGKTPRIEVITLGGETPKSGSQIEFIRGGRLVRARVTRLAPAKAQGSGLETSEVIEAEEI